MESFSPGAAGAAVRELGTRFLLYPQAPYIAGYNVPERVWVSPPAGTVSAGPSDDRMYVVEPVDKFDPYQFPYLPPYSGPTHPPPEPDLDGHFDYLTLGDPGFLAAHLYGSARRVLDLWESYFGGLIDWHFYPDFARLELIPLVTWENAQSGYGFMEFGCSYDERGEIQPFALNFDVIAHEIGHMLLFGLSGVPAPDGRTTEFFGFHEAAADLVTLLSTLHFDSVVDRLLRSTHGDLYTLNEINRIAELSDNRQIRLASNDRKLSEVTDDAHDLSRPFTGAVFDILVDIYLQILVERDLIEPSVAKASRRVVEQRDAARIQSYFAEAYAHRHFLFKAALVDARDVVGALLAFSWSRMGCERLGYRDVVASLLAADRELFGGRYDPHISESFRWREIID